MAKKNGISYAGEYVSSNVYDISVNEPGTYEIWANVDGGASKKVSSVVVSGLEVYNVDVVYADSVLENNDWATISNISKVGKATNFWSVGDVKTIVLSGGVLAYTFDNFSADAFIIGINHNASLEGSNLIHFQISKKFAFCDGYYNDTGSNPAFRMKLQSNIDNYGGWKNSYGRQNVCYYFVNCLPDALYKVLKYVTKYTDNVGNKNNYAASITATSERIFFLSEYELFGSIVNSDKYEADKQSQYRYYAYGNSKIRVNPKTSSNVYWWLRSVWSNSTSGFCATYNGVSTTATNSSVSWGVCPCFCV